MSIRLIARLDIKSKHLIKGIQMEGWRIVGDPSARAEKYYLDGIDEILYIDVVASLYQRNNLSEILEEAARHAFIPITVGGGITDVQSAKALMDVGADKIAVNTSATRRPELLTELSVAFGSQAVVLNIEAKRLQSGGWTVMTDNGRNQTGLDAVEWAARASKLGVGEILISSIDQDGTKRGMDIDLIASISQEVDLPIIASGGCASSSHALSAIDNGANAISIGAALHTERLCLKQLRSDLRASGCQVRPLPNTANQYV